jgi:PAS domain S-box-containing protein
LIDAGVLTDRDGAPSASSVDSDPTQTAHLSNQPNHSRLFSHLNCGFACGKILFDEQQNPVDYVFTDVNHAFKRMIKLKGKQIQGKTATEVMPDWKNPSFNWVGMLGKVVETGRSISFERYFKSLDRWFMVNVFCPQKGCFAMLFTDVTGHKKAHDAIKQSEKQYRRLTSSLNDVFFAVDSCLKITYWNHATEEVTGIIRDNVLGKAFFEVFGKGKAARKAAKVYFDVMKTRKSRVFFNEIPTVEGRIFDIEVNPTGNGVSVVAKDITHHKKLQGSLQNYAQHLEELVAERTEKLRGLERLASIGETAGMIGHDIRNPLQSIIGELYLVKEDVEGLPEGESKQHLLEGLLTIEEQAGFINKILTDMQDYIKPLTPFIQETDIKEVLENVISTIEPPDNIKVSYSISSDMPTLKTDSLFLKRILTNLAVNGIQAMQEKPTGELNINAFPRAKSVIIAISDTGTGIPEAVRPKIFRPLFTTKAKGQGFGLAVVKKLIQALDGYIIFETEIGKGTTFIIEIPNAQNSS